MLELRPYQEEDVKFIMERKICGIFNEQRTGKTPTVLTALNRMGCKKIIIVCPASTVPQWAEEFTRWTGRPCIQLTGHAVSKKFIQMDNWTDGIAVSYETFKSVLEGPGVYAELLIRKPDAIILDEAHRIKNHKTQNFKTLSCCTKVPVRVALTGTPAPNKPHDIFGILHFLFPKTYSSYWNFINEYFTTFRKNARGRTFMEVGDFKPGKRVELQQFLNRHCIQRKRKDVMDWLPDKDYQEIKLETTPKQQAYIDELLKYFEIKNTDIITKTLLDRLIRIRQLCLDPAILDLKSEAAPKTTWIKQYIKDYPDRPTLIFSKSTKYIFALEHDLLDPNTDIIVGATPIEKRHKIVKAFQEGKLKRLLINIDAGKEGLTLDKAEVIIFTDKYPPAGDIAQAEDRFVATTVDKANKSHLIIELMMKGTYDEELYRLVKRRFSETDVINNFKKYINQDVTEDEEEFVSEI